MESWLSLAEWGCTNELNKCLGSNSVHWVHNKICMTMIQWVLWLKAHSSGNAHLCSSQLAEPLWTDSSPKEWSLCMRADLHFKRKEKEKNGAGGEWLIEPYPIIFACEEEPPTNISRCWHDSCKIHWLTRMQAVLFLTDSLWSMYTQST